MHDGGRKRSQHRSGAKSYEHPGGRDDRKPGEEEEEREKVEVVSLGKRESSNGRKDCEKSGEG